MGATSNSRVSGVASAIILQTGVPAGVAPSGTMADNGAITLGTALLKTYSSGLFLFLPANAISAGSAAGSYWCVMSSTTVGQVFNNTLSGIPEVPGSPTAFVTTGPGAFTGATGASRNCGTFVVPGGSMGPRGSVRCNFEWGYTNSVGAKNHIPTFGGTTIVQVNRTTTSHDSTTYRIKNQGVVTVQNAMNVSEANAASTGGYIPMAINTAADVSLIVGCQTNTATDWIISEACCIEVLPGY